MTVIAGSLAEGEPSVAVLARGYLSLLKPRVMSLVVFTGLVGVMMVPSSVPMPKIVMIVLAIAMSAGGAGCLNMWYERDIDGKMNRTKNRPLVTKLISPDSALIFGVMVSGIAFMVMGLVANWWAAFLLTFANLFYVLVYTVLLKRHSDQNIVIGGLAGALPPLIGWVAVSPHYDPLPILLTLLIFLWTPPHFWALALFSSDDYARAQLPMLPLTRGVAVTKRTIMVYVFLVLLTASAIGYLLPAHSLYVWLQPILSLLFLGFYAMLYRMSKQIWYRRAFYISILYLFGLFLLLLVDKMV